MRSSLTRLLRDESGQTLVFGMLALGTLIAVVALVLDVGSWMRAQRRAQSVADAAALAGAQAPRSGGRRWQCRQLRASEQLDRHAASVAVPGSVDDQGRRSGRRLWSVRAARRDVQHLDRRARERARGCVGHASERRADRAQVSAADPAGLRSADCLIDLLDELSGEGDSHLNTIGIINASYRSLHDPAQMKREPIRRLSGPHARAARLEVVTEVAKLCSNRFCDENFV